MTLPIWPICPSFEVNGLDWQCCLAGSSKTAPRIFIFSNFLGAEYLSFVKSIATFALTFFRYIISVLASVYRVPQYKMTNIKQWVWWVYGLHKLHFQLFMVGYYVKGAIIYILQISCYRIDDLQHLHSNSKTYLVSKWI